MSCDKCRTACNYCGEIYGDREKALLTTVKTLLHDVESAPSDMTMTAAMWMQIDALRKLTAH